MWALADAYEAQTKQPIAEDERLQAWRDTPRRIGGASVQDALGAMQRAGLIPEAAFLGIGHASMPPCVIVRDGHALAIVAESGDWVTVRDPAFARAYLERARVFERFQAWAIMEAR